jgi:hypothetical protein
MKRFTPQPLATALAATLAFGAASALAALPPMEHQGKVEYLTGGIGKGESDSIKQAESKFPLALEFVQKAKPHDEYLANVDVRVIDHRGHDVLATRTDGPFLLAKLPSGEYTVKATYDGHTLEKKVHVVDRASAREVFVWAAPR